LLNTTIYTDEKSIVKVSFLWEFAQEFTKELKSGYDKNSDDNFDKEELEEMEDALLGYLIDKNYLTTVKFYDMETNQEFKQIEKLIINPIKSKVDFLGGKLYFAYEFETKYELRDDYVIFLQVNDSGGYFKFMFEPGSIRFENSSKFHFVENIRANLAYIHIKDEIVKKKEELKKDFQDKAEIEDEPKELEEELGFLSKALKWKYKCVCDASSFFIDLWRCSRFWSRAWEKCSGKLYFLN
jgi:nickel/cobalt exporter